MDVIVGGDSQGNHRKTQVGKSRLPSVSLVHAGKDLPSFGLTEQRQSDQRTTERSSKQSQAGICRTYSRVL